MRRPMMAAFFAVMVGCGDGGGRGEESLWTSVSLEDALNKASASGKPILAYFTADW